MRPLHERTFEDLSPGERAEIIRTFLGDEAAMRRAAARYAEGLGADAAASA